MHRSRGGGTYCNAALSGVTVHIPVALSCVCSVQDPLEFPAHEVRKYFRMGDHVKVIAGRYEGDTGLIVRVEENFVILFSDLTMHEVRGLQCLHPPFLTLHRVRA